MSLGPFVCFTVFYTYVQPIYNGSLPWLFGSITTKYHRPELSLMVFFFHYFLDDGLFGYHYFQSLYISSASLH